MIADSMVSSRQIVDGDPREIRFEHGRKMFHLGKSAPAAAIVNGVGNVGSAPIGRFLREASAELDEQQSHDHEQCVSAVAARMKPAFHEIVAEEKRSAAAAINADPAMMAKINTELRKAAKPAIKSMTPEIVGVFGMKSDAATVWEIEVPRPTVIVRSYFGVPKATTLEWPAIGTISSTDRAASGGGDPVDRRCFDSSWMRLRFHRSRCGKDFGGEGVVKIPGRVEDRIRMPLALDIMPIQQAVYLSEFLADVAAGYDRFCIGAPCVGGEMDVVVLVDGALKWIQKQRLSSKPSGAGSGWLGVAARAFKTRNCCTNSSEYLSSNFLAR